MRALVNTWKYIQNMSPKHVVDGLCMHETVKFDGATFDFKFWKYTDMRQIGQGLKDADNKTSP